MYLRAFEGEKYYKSKLIFLSINAKQSDLEQQAFLSYIHVNVVLFICYGYREIHIAHFLFLSIYHAFCDKIERIFRKCLMTS